MKPHRFFLIGPAGTGKTTVGRQLAHRLNFNFYDTDEEIERTTGVSINTIFDIEGEAGFREREKKILDALTQGNNIVLSTGGGIVLAEENRVLLQSRGTVIYLKASQETQLTRVQLRKGTRPLMANQDPVKKIQELSEIRGPLYTNIAHYAHDTDSVSPKNIVDWIVGNVL